MLLEQIPALVAMGFLALGSAFFSVSVAEATGLLRKNDTSNCEPSTAVTRRVSLISFSVKPV